MVKAVRPEIKRAAAYPRVSTDDQAEHGYSLDDQVAKCRAMAVAKGWEMVEESYVEDGVSGSWRHRPSLDRLLGDIKAGRIDVVIVTKMDRLARRLKLLLELWDLIESYGATVVVIEESIDTSTHTGRLIRNVLASIAEWERETIRERTMSGKRAKIARDEVLRTPASASYAYRYVRRDKLNHSGGALEIIEDLRPTAHRIFELVAGGMSTIKVAELLTREGVPTQKGLTKWAFSTVRQIIKNSTYMGKAPHHRQVVTGTEEDKETGKKKQIRKTRELDEDDYSPCPAIVSEELWLAANAQLTVNQKQSRRNAKHDYLLGGGMLKCGQCGYTMTGIRRAKNAIYYRCSHFEPDGRRVIHTVNGHEAERAVWSELCGLLRDQSKAVAALQTLADEASTEARELEGQIAAARRTAASLGVQGDRLLDLYLSGGLPKDKYESKAAALEEQSQRLRDHAADLAGRRDAALQQMLPVEEVKALCAHYATRLDDMTFAEKRTVLSTFVTSLVAWPEKVTMSGYLGRRPVTVGFAKADACPLDHGERDTSGQPSTQYGSYRAMPFTLYVSLRPLPAAGLAAR